MQREPAMQCGAATRQGGVCKRPAGWGTSHTGTGSCKNHGGSTPSGTQAALREQSDRELAKHSLATGIRIEPLDALLHVVYATAGRVEWFRRKIEAAENADEPMIAASELHAAAKLHGSELIRLAQVSKMALDAGVAERRVQMAERTAALIGAAAEAAFAELGEAATPELRATFARAFASRLAVLESTGEDMETVPELTASV
jgi:hypothetical protein